MSCVDLEAAHSGDENGDDGYHTDRDLDEYESDGLGPEKLGADDYETGEEPEDVDTQLHRRAEAEYELEQQREKAKAIRKEKKRLIREKMLQEEAEDLLDKKKPHKRLKKLPRDDDDDDADIEVQRLLPADSGNETEELDAGVAAAAPLGYADASKVKKQSSMFQFMTTSSSSTKRPDWIVGDKFVASVNNTKETHSWKVEVLGELVPPELTARTWGKDSYAKCTPAHYTTASRKNGDETIYEVFLLGNDGFIHHVTRDGALIIEGNTPNAVDRRKQARSMFNTRRNNVTGATELILPVTYYNHMCRTQVKKEKDMEEGNVVYNTCEWMLEQLATRQGLSSSQLMKVFDAGLDQWKSWEQESHGSPAKIWSKMKEVHGKECGKALLFILPFLSERAMKKLKAWIKDLQKKEQSSAGSSGTAPP